jgi:hypothetical protein
MNSERTESLTHEKIKKINILKSPNIQPILRVTIQLTSHISRKASSTIPRSPRPTVGVFHDIRNDHIAAITTGRIDNNRNNRKLDQQFHNFLILIFVPI